MKKLMGSLVAVSALINVAHADSYSITAARVSGRYSCTYSRANGGSLQCSTDYSAQANVAIAMNAKSDGTGYIGADQVTEANTVAILALEADASKNLTAVSTMQLSATSNNSVDGGISANTSSTLAVVNIAPFHVESIDNQTAQVSLSFYAYAPATVSNMVTSPTHDQLNQYILAKIQPMIAAALNK